ncbi:hypothetical protein B0H11DRAFT_1745867 [Mycena galericulata]|nr:hypothetical protein B0H11DRAFT_1745867 [Mycena galericulata]
MDEVSTLRTEIKGWERSFKATHGRDPSVQDIKKQPGLAEKYRKYKKLSKGVEPAPSTRPSNPPSTPPRTKSRDSAHPSLLLSRPRPIVAAQPLSGYNPFSPQKNKGKQKELSPDVSSKANLVNITHGTSSNPVPPVPSVSADDPFAPTPNNPITRARKRLRGEPVSPSPNKEKRRRIVSAHEESDDEDEDRAANTSFVDDSPVKPPNGVRSFKLLFDEAFAKPVFPASRSKTLPAGLFHERIVPVGGTEKMDIDGAPPRLIEKPPTTTSLGLRVSEDDPFAEAVEEALNTSDDEMADPRSSHSTARNLLAPSPPPPAQRTSGKPHLHNGKGRGKSIGEGQKETTGSDDSGSDEDAEMDGFGHRIKVFDRNAARGRVQDDDTIDEDAYYLMPRRPPDTDSVQEQSSESESISLPDTLLGILSLAPNPSHGRRDDEVVDELLYGSRRGNYNPSKGGEIWGVGEFEQEREFALNNGRGRGRHATYDDDEDDWEGEGVPWEVGEL